MTPSDWHIAIAAVLCTLCFCVAFVSCFFLYVKYGRPVTRRDLAPLNDAIAEHCARWDTLRGQSWAPLESMSKFRDELNETRHAHEKRMDMHDATLDKFDRAIVVLGEQIKGLKEDWLREKNSLAGTIQNLRRS